jgi:hypothetical protein
MGDMPNYHQWLRPSAESCCLSDSEGNSGRGNGTSPPYLLGAGPSFLAASVALVDETLFRPSFIAGPQKITDAYLLGLAVRNHGRLATFDLSIPIRAVHGAEREHVVSIATAV